MLDFFVHKFVKTVKNGNPFKIIRPLYHNLKLINLTNN